MHDKYSEKILGIKKFVGDMSQIAGIKRYQYLDGKSHGVRAVDFWTGSGLSFTVLLDRCLDIPSASFNGKSLCWKSLAKEMHPNSYDDQGLAWKDGVSFGLLTTCGLTYLGAPCTDQNESLGLHGKISYIPGEDIKTCQEWKDGEYILSVEGSMREISIFGACLRLTRKITAYLGKSEILIQDKVENISFKQSPFMMLYHINIGFPLLSATSKFICPSSKIAAHDEEAENGIEVFDSIQNPMQTYEEKVYYHDMKEDEKGQINCAVISGDLENDFGLSLTYNKKELPEFVQWKKLENQNYVLGIEPSNCWTEGRDKEREWETLDLLEPGESRSFSVKFGVLDGKQEVDGFIKGIKNNVKNKPPEIISRHNMIEIRKERAL